MSSTQSKMYFYENFAKDFDSIVNMYDTNKRLEVVYSELLTEDISNKKLLDAGCGTGWFSKAASERGALVTSMDVGPELLKEVAKKCDSKRIVGSIMDIPFRTNTFDYIVSSEVIEHVPNPKLALRECYRVLKPGGTFVLTTPNAFWYFALVIAQRLNLRPYQGLENWLGFEELKTELRDIGFEIESSYGVHLFPFTISATHSILDYFHQYREKLGPYMVNSVMKCKKSSS